MIAIRWFAKMVSDLVLFGIVNGAYMMSLTVLSFLLIGLLIFVAKISAPFIYTLF